MADTNRNFCGLKQPTIKSVHRFQDITGEKFKEAYKFGTKEGINTRHIYYGAADGYYVQYPAQDTQMDQNRCNCSKYDPRFR